LISNGLRPSILVPCGRHHMRQQFAQCFASGTH
jgi:hypothetical protein